MRDTCETLEATIAIQATVRSLVLTTFRVGATRRGTPRAIEPGMTKQKSKRDFKCQECGHRMTLAQAERASRNVQGCPKCGGADIDLAEGE